jgi:hypothetical protein
MNRIVLDADDMTGIFIQPCILRLMYLPAVNGRSSSKSEIMPLCGYQFQAAGSRVGNDRRMCKPVWIPATGSSIDRCPYLLFPINAERIRLKTNPR